MQIIHISDIDQKDYIEIGLQKLCIEDFHKEIKNISNSSSLLLFGLSLEDFKINLLDGTLEEENMDKLIKFLEE